MDEGGQLEQLSVHCHRLSAAHSEVQEEARRETVTPTEDCRSLKETKDLPWEWAGARI